MQGVPMKVFASESLLGAAGFCSVASSPSTQVPGPMLLGSRARTPLKPSPSLKATLECFDKPREPRELRAPPGIFEQQEAACGAAPRRISALSIRPPPGLDDEGLCTPMTPSVATAENSEGSDSEESARARERRTTLHVRNLPCYFTRDAFLELIDAQGLAGQYDFVYLPMDFKTRQSIGYAFVNFTSNAAAILFRGALHGFKSWAIHSHKVCSVQWSQTQGFDRNIKLVRKSDVMKKTGVPDEYKPAVFVEGLIVPFPNPPLKLRSGPKHLRLQPTMAGYVSSQRFR